MAIKLTADEAWAVYCALDEALAAKSSLPLSLEHLEKLRGRYLRAARVLECIERKNQGAIPIR